MGFMVNTQKIKYLSEQRQEGNKEVETCNEYEYLGATLNGEGTDDQEINKTVNKSEKNDNMFKQNFIFFYFVLRNITNCNNNLSLRVTFNNTFGNL